MPVHASSDSPAAGVRTAGVGAAVLAGWYATILVAAALWVSALPAEKTDGSCDGIGFGCTPSARDGALLLAIFYGLPALAVSFLVSLVMLAVMVAARVRSGLVAGNVAAFTGLVGLAAVAVALVLR
ncbi:hypothetical protein ACQPYA_13765 [Micromonospora sp. CA-263727]|uniref:hypothetical protein n=1 Tax=Micromonospora sp. CA-263727 TaxID=3239967 RepID=UPI003D9266D5